MCIRDRVNREALWQVLVIYSVGGRLLNGIKRMYDDSETCVRINGVKSDWFSINSGVRQGCVMSPWFFNLCMDWVLKELKLSVTGNGVRIMEMSGGCPTYYMRMIWFCVVNLKSLRELVDRFGRVFKRRGLKVYVDKSKVMVVSEESPR